MESQQADPQSHQLKIFKLNDRATTTFVLRINKVKKKNNKVRQRLGTKEQKERERDERERDERERKIDTERKSHVRDIEKERAI